MSFPKTIARFDSECPLCDGSIWEGDEIALIDGEWVCGDHADEEDDEEFPIENENRSEFTNPTDFLFGR